MTMARTTRSTPRQREDIAKLESLLTAALDSVDARFWATNSQRQSYADVVAHVRLWASWESDEAKNHD